MHFSNDVFNLFSKTWIINLSKLQINVLRLEILLQNLHPYRANLDIKKQNHKNTPIFLCYHIVKLNIFFRNNIVSCWMRIKFSFAIWPDKVDRFYKLQFCDTNDHRSVVCKIGWETVIWWQVSWTGLTCGHVGQDQAT